MESTGNSPQCPVLTKMGRNSKEGMYVYIELTHSAVHTPIKVNIKK